MTARMPDADLDTALAPLLAKGWALSADRRSLTRQFRFDDFPQAFGWMTRVALWAQTWDHHPDWRNSHARVEVTLTTHDAGGLTALDLKLAEKMDALA